MKFVFMFDSGGDDEPPKPWWYRVIVVFAVFLVALAIVMTGHVVDVITAN